MPGWDWAVLLILSIAAVILLVLILVRYKESRGMRLALDSVLSVSSAFRLLRAAMVGGKTSWVDAAALVFFGYAAIAEAIPLLRSKTDSKK